MSCSPNVITAFEDRDEAQGAVDEMEQAGFKPDEGGFAIRGDDAVAGGMITDAEGARDGEGAAKGAAAGAAIGGILGALAFAAIPGVGPIMAGGGVAGGGGGGGAGGGAGGDFCGGGGPAAP